MPFGALILLTIIVTLLCIAADGTAGASGPPLVVNTPEDGHLTNNSALLVTGMTEPGAAVNVTVETAARPERCFVHESTAGADGWFEVPVGLFEGIQAVHVTVTDGSGGTNSTSRIITLDTIPPSFGITSPASSPYYTRFDRFTMIIWIDDMTIVHPCVWVQDIEVIEGEGTGLFRQTVNLTEGENVINIRVRDRAGNEAVRTVVIISDLTPPVLDVTEPSSRTVMTNRSTLHLAGNVSGASRVVVVVGERETNATPTSGDWDSGGGWECDLDLGGTDGVWPLEVRALDAVGNMAAWEGGVRLDTWPPRLVMDPSVAYEVDRSIMTVCGTTEPEIEVVLVRGALHPVFDGRFTVHIRLEEGPQVITVEVQDAAGNRHAIEQEVMYSDGTPDLEVEAPGRTWGGHARVRGTTDGNVLQVTVDGAQHPVVNGTFDVEVGLDWGSNELVVEVVDPAGNVRTETVEVHRGLTGVEVGAILALVAGMMAAGAVLWWSRRSIRGEK